jgi:hypothetical protein
VSYWKLVGIAFTAVVGVATVLQTIGTFGASWHDVVEAVWPGVVVGALGVAVIVLGIGLVLERPRVITRPGGPPTAEVPKRSDADQDRIDDLLTLLSRPSIRLIEDQDFAASWPAKTIHPVSILCEEMDDLEHQFDDGELERARAKLTQKARVFRHAEAMNGFPSRHNRGFRDPGWSGGEVEGVPEREKLFDQRHEAMFAARTEFLEAFEAFVTIARTKGFSIDAIKLDRHPRVLQFDAITNPEDGAPPGAGPMPV